MASDDLPVTSQTDGLAGKYKISIVMIWMARLYNIIVHIECTLEYLYAEDCRNFFTTSFGNSCREGGEVEKEQIEMRSLKLF